jgi:glycosyltransferase involved in cell wall biosynthesis
MSKIKVVHISTSNFGGAGRAAYRIHEALLKNGVQSSFLNIVSKGDISNNLFMENIMQTKEMKKTFIDRQFDKFQFHLNKHLGIHLKSRSEKEKRKREQLYSELKEMNSLLDCEIATLPFSDYDILENRLVKEADIIHLHWIAGMLDYPTFFKKNKKKVVWTLHDMNPFQGLFHYKEDEIRNTPIAMELDDRIKVVKSDAIKYRKSSLVIVTPSDWLLKEVIQKSSFKKLEAVCIKYPIDTSLFSPQKKCNFKMINHIPERNMVLLFVAEVVKFKRKGFDLLLEALKYLNHIPLTILVLGHEHQFEIENLDVRFLDTIKDDKTLSSYYSLADAFIIPSREDNLPNVMLESFACGTPVIGFPVGGIKEHVIDFETGLLAEVISSESLAKTIEKFYIHKEKFDRQSIQNYAKKHFNEELIAGKYIHLYKQVLKN